MMTFVEGLLSFVSPCVLPLLPVYLIYFAGEGAEVGTSRRRVFLHAVAFSLGFSLVFVALGVFAGSVGAALAKHQRTVNAVCGAMIVVFGLGFLGWIRLPFKGLKGNALAQRIRGFGSAFLFGVVFSLGLSPCVGAFLGAALMMAASAGGAARGALLLGEYSLGLAIPFILSALLIERLQRLFRFLNAHASAISKFSGALLILLGLHTAIPMPSFAAEKSSAPAVQSAKPKPAAEAPLEVTLTAENFRAEVLAAKLPVVVDFWAPWCGPCRKLAPNLEALAKQCRGRIKVGKVNVDDNEALCAQYGIRSIPALFLFKDGKVVKQTVGYRTVEQLAAWATAKHDRSDF